MHENYIRCLFHCVRISSIQILSIYMLSWKYWVEYDGVNGRNKWYSKNCSSEFYVRDSCRISRHSLFCWNFETEQRYRHEVFKCGSLNRRNQPFTISSHWYIHSHTLLLGKQEANTFPWTVNQLLKNTAKQAARQLLRLRFLMAFQHSRSASYSSIAYKPGWTFGYEQQKHCCKI